jgi:acyl carrier protein
MSSPLNARVKDVIVRTFNVTADDSDLQMGVLPEWDSMGHMQLISELEGEFNVSFPAYDLANLVSVDAIASALQKLEA